jgi:hypothetical protein
MMKVRGPLLTVGAVVVLGVGIWLANIWQRPEPTPASQPVAESPTTAAATPAKQPSPVTPPPPPAPPPPAFPAKADYVGKIPIDGGVLTLDISIDGDKAIAYACDGNSIETWRWGGAQNGAVSLWSKDKKSGLEGRLQGANIVGTVSLGEKKFDFTTAPAQAPAGLYFYENGGVRTSWIIDQNGGVTGVQRRADGSTVPAPGLSVDGTTVTVVIDGRSVPVLRLEGDSTV